MYISVNDLLPEIRESTDERITARRTMQRQCKLKKILTKIVGNNVDNAVILYPKEYRLCKETGHIKRVGVKKDTFSLTLDEIHNLGHLLYYGVTKCDVNLNRACKLVQFTKKSAMCLNVNISVMELVLLINLLGSGFGTAQKDKSRSIELYSIAANEGHTDAQYELGCILEDTVPHSTSNMKQAISWYKRAADNGHFGAMFCLGECYENGKGVPMNKQKAFKHYEIAQSDSYRARYALAVCYSKGSGTKQNPKKATEMFKEMALEGYPSALCSYGFALRHGEGVEKDEEKAVHCYKKAAEKGEPQAMRNLQFCYERGCGVKKNPKLAEEWFMKWCKTNLV